MELLATPPSPLLWSEEHAKAAQYHPPFFAICIESLAQINKDDMNISEKIAGEADHKLLLYADDVFLYLCRTLPALKASIKQCGYYSSYKVNISKTEAMDINIFILSQTKANSKLRWPFV